MLEGVRENICLKVVHIVDDEVVAAGTPAYGVGKLTILEHPRGQLNLRPKSAELDTHLYSFLMKSLAEPPLSTLGCLGGMLVSTSSRSDLVSWRWKPSAPRKYGVVDMGSDASSRVEAGTGR